MTLIPEPRPARLFVAPSRRDLSEHVTRELAEAEWQEIGVHDTTLGFDYDIDAPDGVVLQPDARSLAADLVLAFTGFAEVMVLAMMETTLTIQKLMREGLAGQPGRAARAERKRLSRAIRKTSRYLREQSQPSSRGSWR